MKKKIEARKPGFYPEDFSPEIWRTEHDGYPISFLVCAKSWVHSPFAGEWWARKPSDPISCDRLTHPVAIVMTIPARVYYSLTDDIHVWHCSAPEDSGISRGNAQKALAQAWRGVVAITGASWQTHDFKFHYKSRRAVAGDKSMTTQENTMLRNLNVCLRWDEWQRQGLSRSEASRDLTQSGFPTSETQLNKIVENLELY
jgi:hypothetical protein